MRETVSIYEFVDEWDARLARDALDDAGFEAWLEEASSAAVEGGQRRFRLIVPAEDADEARSVLTEPLAELPKYERDELDTRRPLWIPVVAVLVLVAFVVGYIPRFMWPWILLTTFVGFLLWRTIGPRRP
jgi:Putative prokaryotic signal transducing protein